MRRNRITYAAWILVVVLLGLASRSDSLPAPTLLKEYAGDTLWALAVYLMVAVLFPRLTVGRVVVIAGFLSLAVELSQTYHAPWVDQIRRTRLGGLVLGFGFLWSDLVCYAVGIGIGVLLESSRVWHISSGRRVGPG